LQKRKKKKGAAENGHSWKLAKTYRSSQYWIIKKKIFTPQDLTIKKWKIIIKIIRCKHRLPSCWQKRPFSMAALDFIE